MNQKKILKVISLLLVFVIVVGALPFTAFAINEEITSVSENEQITTFQSFESTLAPGIKQFISSGYAADGGHSSYYGGGGGGGYTTYGKGGEGLGNGNHVCSGGGGGYGPGGQKYGNAGFGGGGCSGGNGGPGICIIQYYAKVNEVSF